MAPDALPAPLPAVRSAVDAATRTELEATLARLEGLTGRLDALVDPGRALLARGKRSRALLAYAGHLAAGGPQEVDAPDPVVRAGAALELFQLAALVHDDVMDGADVRRGLPAAHVAISGTHREQRLDGDAVSFGVAGAILLGDLLLAASSASMDAARAAVDAGPGATARAIYDHMCAEVAAGQYLDVRAAATPLRTDPDGALTRSLTVLRHKSARYSVEHPLALGAALAGGAPELVTGLRAVGEPLGEAFQLRDDELGVFGDPEVTGKPAGDDLREGKRTALLALTWSAAGPDERDEIEALVGDPALDAAGVDRLREVITSTGARAAHERLIDEREQAAGRALTDLALDDAPRQVLEALAAALVTRSA
ncbi:polyprenyl synthetase family protein [Georgenia sp. Z1344]|uniref:polyprenyl synthetase family protein n=1 Tax=Georgenia sp. Z1344 TaxID=3416706 RepID=UPI003CF27E07